MPADASIYGTLRAPTINTPFENLSQILQIRNQQQAAQGLAEQRAAIAEQRQQQTDLLRQQSSDYSAINDAMSRATTPEEAATILRQGGRGALLAKMQEQFQKANDYNDKVQKAKREAETAEREYFGHLAASVKAWEADGPEAMTNAAKAAIEHAKAAGHDVSQWEATLQQNPAQLPRLLDGVIAFAQGPAKPTEPPATVGEGVGVLNKATGKYEVPVPKTPPKPTSAQEYEYRKSLSPEDQKAYDAYQTADANRKRPTTTVVSSGAGSDADSIAEAIATGQQPPVMTGLYRLAGPVRSALARRGYNLTQATLDYDATKKHMSSLNSTQQLRLGQAIETASHALDMIDTLADQWKGGRFPILNRVNLAAARNGAYGKDAQQVATQLEAQITDLTSELGQVYMGGNSPTDHALSLAGKNLSADWSQDTLKTMTALARKNLEIRRNSMSSVGVAGASAGNIYAGGGGAPAAIPTAAPAAPAGAAPSGDRVRVKGPNGETGSVPKGTKLPPGWSVVGG